MTTDAIKTFDSFYKEFRKTDLWKAMVNTREDSPWHREPNVGVHTQMLLDWYMRNLAHYRNETQQMFTLVGCLFHDTGKPPAEIIKHSPERGEYRAYHGHEQLSARIWTDYAMSHKEQVFGDLKFNLSDITNVALMLEHHVPFALKDTKKRKALKTAFMQRMGADGHRAWLDMLLSDQHGRNSDNQAEKLAAVDVWMKDWEAL